MCRSIRGIAIAFALLSLLSACDPASSNATQSEAGLFRNIEKDPIRMATGAYSDFLEGNRGVRIDDEELWTENASEDRIRYAIFDMNGDAIPELHIYSWGVRGNAYDIFSYQENEMVLWYSGVSYEQPLNNGAILHTYHGAAPKHDIYLYKTLNFHGEIQVQLSFQRGDRNENGIYDDADDYFFEEVPVSKEQWGQLTKKYLSIHADQIQWKNIPKQYLLK